LDKIKQTLILRLVKKGLETDLIPNFIRSLANFYIVNPQMSISQVNQKMQYVGWAGVEMDYHTFQLALACFEDEGLKRLENKPVGWFAKRFDPYLLWADDKPASTTKAVL
jgi:hypothetical protein